jgi:hypothetical protein
MKTTLEFCGRQFSRLFLVFTLASGCVLKLAAADDTNKPAPADKAISLPTEAPDEYRNWVELGVGSTFISGDRAAFQRRSDLPRGPFGGIEDFHYEQDLGKRGLLQLDGRAIFDNHDYDIKLDVSHPDIGYVRAGYREFRTYYDGSGGFSARSNAWVTLYNEEFEIDRRDAWIEAALTLPDWPVFTVRYSYETREGTKDSTIWGDYSLTGDTANLRAIAPTFRDIDEHRHIIDASVKHTIGQTDFGIGFRYERDSIDNSLNIARRPGDPARQRVATQTDTTDAEIFSPRAFSETQLHPNVLLTVGGAYTRLDTDIGGSRIYGPSYYSPFNPLYINRQNNDEGFLDASGGSQVDQYVGNVNLMLTPWEHVTIVPALRIEHQDQQGETFFTETRITNAATAASLENLFNTRERTFTDVTESLEARYTGLTNWAFYARSEWLEGQGTLRENEFDVAEEGVGPVQLQRSTDSERFVQKYTAGVNWYPNRKVNFGGQYYYRTRQNDYDHIVDSTIFAPPNTNNLYPAFILRNEFETHDMNVRMTLRPLPNLTLISRYDFQLTTYRMRGGVDSFGFALAEAPSAESTSHIFSENVSWVPLPRLYLQGSITYALERTDSPASSLTGPAQGLVQDAQNDYWNATALVGYALTQRTDLQTQYFYYRADNYDTGNAAVGLPYGAGAEQHGVTVTLIHQLAKNMVLRLQYGFAASHDQTSGGNNDYTAHMVMATMRYHF